MPREESWQERLAGSVSSLTGALCSVAAAAPSVFYGHQSASKEYVIYSVYREYNLHVIIFFYKKEVYT